MRQRAMIALALAASPKSCSPDERRGLDDHRADPDPACCCASCSANSACRSSSFTMTSASRFEICDARGDVCGQNVEQGTFASGGDPHPYARGLLAAPFTAPTGPAAGRSRHPPSPTRRRTTVLCAGVQLGAAPLREAMPPNVEFGPAGSRAAFGRTSRECAATYGRSPKTSPLNPAGHKPSSQ